MGLFDRIFKKSKQESASVDRSDIHAFYYSLSDEEFVRLLTSNSSGLTEEALQIIKDEIHRRKLDPAIYKVVEAQQEKEEIPYKVFDKDACPVDEERRVRLETSFGFLLQIFGIENTKNRKVLVPERSDFPLRYDGSERAAYETLTIVAKQMEVPTEHISLDFYDDTLRQITEGSPGGLYWGRGKKGSFEISLVRTKLDDPEAMVAVLAHEIAHIKLLGENKLAENDEEVTDMTTVFFGLGIFPANQALKTSVAGWSQLGYLTQMDWGYTLALFAFTRGEEDPRWADYLCKNVKSDFLQAMNFIRQNEELIFKTTDALDGKWKGTYSYGKSYGDDLAGKIVQFVMDLNFVDGRVTGYCRDIGEIEKVFEEPAKIEGTFVLDHISFTKKYPGLLVADEKNYYGYSDESPAEITYHGKLKTELLSRTKCFKGTWKLKARFLKENDEVVIVENEGTWSMEKES